MATAYGCRRRTHPQEHPHACPANCGQICAALIGCAICRHRRLLGAIWLAPGCLSRPIVPPPWPQLADLDIAEWPALLRLRAATRPARLATAGRQRIGHRLGVGLRQRCLGPQLPHHRFITRGPGLWCWFECCRIRADFPRPARLAPWWGQHLEARQELGLTRVGLHLPRSAAWPFYRCCHGVRCCSGGHDRHRGCGLGFCRHPFAVRRPQHDGAIHQFGLEVVAGLEVEQVTKAGRQGQPAVIMQFEGRQEIYPKGAKARSFPIQARVGAGPDRGPAPVFSLPA